MSNDATFGISVKDYAAQRGKTIQAVYQQMKRKENAAALKGHVHLHRVGNKNVKYLDDEAVAILDRSSNSAPLVILEDGLKESLVTMEREKDAWKDEAHKLQGKVELLKEMLAEKEAALRLLDEPKSKIEAQEARISDLSAEIEEAKAKALEAEKSAQAASDELTAARAEIEEMKKAGFWRRLRGWKNKE